MFICYKFRIEYLHFNYFSSEFGRIRHLHQLKTAIWSWCSTVRFASLSFLAVWWVVNLLVWKVSNIRQSLIYCFCDIFRPQWKSKRKSNTQTAPGSTTREGITGWLFEPLHLPRIIIGHSNRAQNQTLKKQRLEYQYQFIHLSIVLIIMMYQITY